MENLRFKLNDLLSKIENIISYKVIETSITVWNIEVYVLEEVYVAELLCDNDLEKSIITKLYNDLRGTRGSYCMNIKMVLK